MPFIDADDQGTWPQTLRDILNRHEKSIRAYHAERAAIDRAAEDDVMLRINRPGNPYAPPWHHALEIANDAVHGKFLLGFHATRLTEREAQDIRVSGLQILSVDLLNRRLAALRDSGEFDQDVFEALSTGHQAADDNRANKIWFVFSRSTLKDESGMERFFRSWGGEALYNSHERHARTGPALKRPGTPSIVQASVPCDGLECFIDVGTRLVNVWCEANGISTGHGADFEGYVAASIPPENIRRIDHLGSESFDALTEHAGWRSPLTR